MSLSYYYYSSLSLDWLELSKGIFEVFVKGPVSIISFSLCLSFLYKKAMNFCVYVNFVSSYFAENVFQLQRIPSGDFITFCQSLPQQIQVGCLEGDTRLRKWQIERN